MFIRHENCSVSTHKKVDHVGEKKFDIQIVESNETIMEESQNKFSIFFDISPENIVLRSGKVKDFKRVAMNYL